MWVFEEIVNGEKLSETINTKHENVKYLPGVKLPDNVVSKGLITKWLCFMDNVSLKWIVVIVIIVVVINF